MSTCGFWMFETSTSAMNIWPDYAKMMLILIGICIIALATVKWLVPKFRGLAAPDSNIIQLFARYPLEPRKTLYLVKVGKTMVLLATSGETIHFMATLDPGDFEEVATPIHSTAGNDSAFRRIAQAFANRYPGKSL